MADRAQADLQQIIALLAQLDRAINLTRTSLEQGSATMSAQVAIAEKLIAMQSTRNKLLQEESRIRGSMGGARAGYVPGGSPEQAAPGQRPLEPVRISPLSFVTDREKLKAQKATDAYVQMLQKEIKATEASAKAAQHLADARNKVANDPRYRMALEQAQEKGLGPQDLRSIEDRGGGVQQLSFADQRGGINKRFRTYVNEQGVATPGLSSQFRSFGSDILRDIGQFTKWSIAVAAVYTPLKKLGELITVMIDNESKLADAVIAANVPFERAGEIFDASAEAANRAGESIGGVIDAYAQAIRAAGRYESETEKTQKAQALLNDSLILSKLSALDQATAIDTLSAALLQSDRELDQGQEILNKWVRVSQIANVGIDGLATGVAVLGDSAETVGLSIDKLNGLIAVLSENSISGSKEAANTAKALVASYQSDKAEAALNKYGIALRKANGEVRGFLEIYQDLARLRQQGVLSEPNVTEIATALGGGGSRRSAQASALINQQDRLNAIAKESASVTGADTLANDALAKKLETVQTANTRLANSFQSLAQTLGDDGGLLDLFKGLINLMTGITKGADELFTLLGRSGPLLATFAVSLLAISKIPSGTKEIALAQLSGLGAGSFYRGGTFIPGGGRAPLGGTTIGGNPLLRAGGGALSDILQMNRRGGMLLGGASTIGAILSNLKAGKNENALANAVGGIIGGAIGSTLTGGIGIAAGAAIGSSVADSFVTGLTTHSQDLSDYFAGVVKESSQKAEGEAVAPKEITTEELIKQAYQAIGGGNELLGSIRAYFEFVNSQKRTPTQQIQYGQPGSYVTQEAAAIELLKKVNPQLYAQLASKQQFQQAQGGILPAGTSPAEVERNRRQIQDLQKLAEEERTRQLQKVSTGELRPSEFGKISERLAGFPTAAKQEIDAFGKAFINVSKDIDNTSDAYNAFLELTVNGTEEQQAQINSYVSDINKMQAAWDNWVPGEKTLDLTTGTKTFKTKEELGGYLAQTQQQAAQFTTSSIINARLQQLRLPGIVGSATEATSAPDVEQIKQQAEKLQEQFYNDMNLTNEEIEHLRNSLEDFSLLVERSGEEHFETISGIDQKFWDAAQKLLVEQGKLKEEKGIGFQKFDVPIGTLRDLAQRSLQIGQGWQQKFNYDFKPEDQIAIDNQGIVQPLHADFKILGLLLEKLVDQGQKQLDGQYNIPEGATFWVPLTAAYYRRGPGGEGGGDLSSMLDSLAVETNTGATDRNTSALDRLSERFMMKNQPEDFRKESGQTGRAGARSTKELQYEHLLREYGMDNSNRAAITKEQQYRHVLRENAGDTTPSAVEKGPFTGKYGRDYSPVMESIKNFFQSLFGPGSALGGLNTVGQGAGAMSTTGINNKTMPTTAPTTPTSKLDLKISSNVNLLVDGRILASTLQNYLASELLRTEQSQGTISKRFII